MRSRARVQHHHHEWVNRTHELHTIFFDTVCVKCVSMISDNMTKVRLMETKGGDVGRKSGSRAAGPGGDEGAEPPHIGIIRRVINYIIL